MENIWGEILFGIGMWNYLIEGYNKYCLYLFIKFEKKMF